MGMYKANNGSHSLRIADNAAKIFIGILADLMMISNVNLLTINGNYYHGERQCFPDLKCVWVYQNYNYCWTKVFVSASILVSMMVVLLLSLPLTLLVITLLETVTYILKNELAYRWLILCLRLLSVYFLSYHGCLLALNL